MNPDIEEFLNNYRKQIDGYAQKLPGGDRTLDEAMAYLEKIADVGRTCSDIGTFMGKMVETDMMNKMTQYLTDLAMASLSKERASGSVRIPTPSELADGYHRSYDSIEDKAGSPETCRVYERIFELEKECQDGAEFLARLVEESLLLKIASVPLKEVSKKAMNDSDNMSLPTMVYHHEKMIEMSEMAKSALEIQYESQRLMELNRYELTCDMMLTNDLVGNISIPVIDYFFNPSEENRRQVESSYRFLAEFFGIDADELFSIPRVLDHIENAVLREVRKQHPETTRDTFIEDAKNIIKKCMQGKPELKKGPEAHNSFRIWDKRYRLVDALKVMKNPPRPDEYQT